MREEFLELTNYQNGKYKKRDPYFYLTSLKMYKDSLFANLSKIIHGLEKTCSSDFTPEFQEEVLILLAYILYPKDIKDSNLNRNTQVILCNHII